MSEPTELLRLPRRDLLTLPAGVVAVDEKGFVWYKSPAVDSAEFMRGVRPDDADTPHVVEPGEHA